MLGLSVVGAFILGYAIKFFLVRLIAHLVEISLGIWLTVGVYLYGVVRFSDDRAAVDKLRTRKVLESYRPYAFLRKDNWERELEVLNRENPIPESLFQESFVISDSLDSIIEYVIRDFVLSWYRKFSTDTKFPRQLDIAIRHAVAELADRLKKLDAADFVAEKLLPLVTHHYGTFVRARSSVFEKSIRRQLTESRELDMAVALEYRRLHDAIVLKTFDHPDYRKRWLATKVSEIVPLLLNPNDGQSSIVKALTTDIVAGAILFPILSICSDPDFLNQTVMKAADSTLQDQRKVEELRKALDAHSGSTISAGSVASSSVRKKRSLAGLRLSPNADQSSYEKFRRAISKLKSLPEARQTRFYISVQLKRLGKEGIDNTYRKRLENAKLLVDQKIAEFSGETTSQTVSSGSTKDLSKDPREAYTLGDILNDASCSLVFMEFMDRRKRTVLLQFWLTVNSLRDPLVDVLDEDRTTVDPLGGLVVDNDRMDAKIDMSNKEDILQIFDSYLRDNRIHADTEQVEIVKRFSDTVTTGECTPNEYMNARRALLAIQDSVFHRIEQRDLSKFKNSDLFVKFLATTRPLDTKNLEISVDNLQVDTIDDIWDFSSTTIDDYTNVDHTQDEEKTLHAVEEAFNDIMKAPDGLKEEPVREKLFDSENEDEEDDDRLSADVQQQHTDLDAADQLHFAAPGDLSLTEAIAVLTEDIERLYKQQKMIESLVRKAELTNNNGDLRILRKSLSSMERETQRKELQRQQYMVQESDNSLYGRSDIQIPSYINAFDSNGQYTLYIIEVVKFAGVNRKDVSAGWVVARRYTQFHELHSHLREQFVEVRGLDFPKKKLLLKFQHKSLVDARRLALQKYLKELLKIEWVCKSKAFRLFLSSETFSLDNLQANDLVRARSPFDRDDLVTRTIPLRATSPTLPSPTSSSSANQSQSHLELSLSEADFEIMEQGNLHPFVQSVCDFFIEVFGLNLGNNWIRGRAVIVVLQQLLGGTIEKKLRDSINTYTSIQRISDLVELLRDTMWPNGVKRPPGIPRTAAEKTKTKHESMVLLHKLLHDTFSKVVGSSSTRYASRNLFAMYQNEFLNAHLVYSVFDLIVEELFPELRESMITG